MTETPLLVSGARGSLALLRQIDRNTGSGKGQDEVSQLLVGSLTTGKLYVPVLIEPSEANSIASANTLALYRGYSLATMEFGLLFVSNGLHVSLPEEIHEILIMHKPVPISNRVVSVSKSGGKRFITSRVAYPDKTWKHGVAFMYRQPT